jgi:hypothetical protein
VTARAPDAAPAGLIFLAVLVANGPALLHLVTSNPLVINANLVLPGKSGWLPGLPYIDPNAGYTTQALGHLAALDWLHGHVPWWNPYEGLGSPLAGEMQSGAFFPLTLVLALHQGMLVLQVLLESITGWATYLLLKQLGIGRTIATAGGVAFGLCGTYAWFAHAPIRPVMLLPVCLLGVEHAVTAALRQRRGGWQLLAVGIGLSVLAGFPEVAFLDAAFVGWWFLIRLTGPSRRQWRRIATKVAGGVAVGVALGAPLIVAFTGYLPYANVGAHSGAIAHGALPTEGLPQLVLPYSLGPVFGFRTATPGPALLSDLWGNVGGYLTVTIIAAALVGLIGRRQRWLRLGLGAWVLITLLRVYGYPPLVRTMSSLPGFRVTAFYRYAAPTWELAVVVLAGLGLDDIARARSRRRSLVATASITGVVAVWAAVTAWPLLDHVTSPGHPAATGHVYTVASLIGALVALAVLVGGATLAGGPRHRHASSGHHDNQRRRRWGRILMAVAVGGESVVLLGFTYLSAPTPTPLQSGSVNWLQAHLGTYRFYTLGPIQPNYGSYFGIAQANSEDLPTPAAWTTYIEGRLDSNARSDGFTALSRKNPDEPTPAQELTRNLVNYESVGVRFVVEDASGRDIQGQPFPGAGSPPWPLGPRLVYHDNFAEIWELPHPAPAFSLTPVVGAGRSPDPSCTVVGSGWDRATIRCLHPTTLIRKVQYVPGWTAHLLDSDRSLAARQEGPAGLFQQVRVPAGTTTVVFTYLPPHEDLAIALAVLAAMTLLASLTYGVLAEVRRTRDERSAPGMDPEATSRRQVGEPEGQVH